MFRMGKNTTPERPETTKPTTTAVNPATEAASPNTATQSQQFSQHAEPVQTQTPLTQTTSANASVDKSASASRAVSETDALARDIREGLVSGFVGGGTTLKGDANFKGMLRVDGHLSGRITSDKGTLIVSSGGQVDANIEVGIARINGTVNGDIIATERIEFGRTAKVSGNVQTPALIIEQGALFDGSCRMSQPTAAPEKVREEKHEEKKEMPRAQIASAAPSVAKEAVNKYEMSKTATKNQPPAERTTV
ncbi:MAG: polymer-forming cytoskeletal protein [Pyrinomonadaceae bacterium]